MKKSYLSYTSEVSFGLINSSGCKSIELLFNNFLLTSDGVDVNLWDTKLSEIKLSFRYKPDNYTPNDHVTSFVSINHNLNSRSSNNKKEVHLFVGYGTGTIRRFVLSPDLVSFLLSQGTSASEYNDLNNLYKANDVWVLNEDGVLYGHSKPITHMSSSVDGTMLISCGNDDKILLWDVFNCQLLYTLKNNCINTSVVYHCNYSKQGSTVSGNAELGHVISADKNNAIKVWDILNETCVNTVIEPLLQLNRLYLSQDKLFVLYRNNNVVNCYSVEDVHNIKLLYSINNRLNNLAINHLFVCDYNLDPLGFVDNQQGFYGHGFSGYVDAKKSEQKSAKILYTVYNKYLYFYKLLDRNEVENKRNKRLRRINEKLKVKVNKLLKVIKLTMNSNKLKEIYDNLNNLENFHNKYTYLKGLLGGNNTENTSDTTNQEGKENEDNNLSNQENKDNTEKKDKDKENNNEDNEEVKEKKELEDNLEGYVDEDHYKLLYVHSLDDNINNVNLYGNKLVVGYNNNHVDLYYVDVDVLVGNRSKERMGLDGYNEDNEHRDDNGDNNNLSNENKNNEEVKVKDEPLSLLYKLDKYHTDRIRLCRLSDGNNLLLTVSNESMVLYNTLGSNVNHNVVAKISKFQISNRNEVMEPKDVLNVLFLNNSNILLLNKKNEVILYNVNTDSFYFVGNVNNTNETQTNNTNYNNNNNNTYGRDLEDEEENNEYLKDDNEILNMYLLSSRGSTSNLNLREKEVEVFDGLEMVLLLVYKHNYVKIVNVIRSVVLGELNINQAIVNSKMGENNLYLVLNNNNVIVINMNLLNDGSYKLKTNKILYGHKLPINDLSVTGDDIMLATSSLDKTVKIWDVKFGSIRKSFIFGHLINLINYVSNTHYLVVVSNNNNIKLYDCDLFVLITEIGNCYNTINHLVHSNNYNLFFYLIGNNYGVSKYMLNNSNIIFPEEEQERLENLKHFKNNQLLDQVERLTSLLEEGDDVINVRMVNNLLVNVNYNMVYNMLLLMPTVSVQQLMENIVSVFGMVDRNKELMNVEYLVYIVLNMIEINFKQLLMNKKNVYNLKKYVTYYLNQYLDMVQYNKNGLEYIKNIIVTNNESNLKRLQ